MNSDRWRISTRIRRSRTGMKLLANLCANLGKQCLQGVLNGNRKLGIGKSVNHLTYSRKRNDQTVRRSKHGNK
uniref:Uncharacterized protein n=1 Tax=Tanacetum cinerariifolium TaxID=118510 RepID=A0A699SSJ5_TANCI|nr:hypothetical protein [Tanacetum cinerariifolium]